MSMPSDGNENCIFAKPLLGMQDISKTVHYCYKPVKAERVRCYLLQLSICVVL